MSSGLSLSGVTPSWLALRHSFLLILLIFLSLSLSRVTPSLLITDLGFGSAGPYLISLALARENKYKRGDRLWLYQALSCDLKPLKRGRGFKFN